MDFVGTKKKEGTIPCQFCSKQSSNIYCSKFCESEDNRLRSLNPGKSYSDYLNEKGMKAPVVPEL